MNSVRSNGFRIGLPLALVLATTVTRPFSQGRPEISFSRLDSLFIAASSGEPRFQELRDSSRKILEQMGDTALEYMMRERLAGQTPRRRHFVQQHFTTVSDSGANPGAAQVLAQWLPNVEDSLKAQILWIGSKLGDAGFLPQAYSYVHHDSLSVRLMAWRILGAYPRQESLDTLFRGLESTSGSELHKRLWALGEYSSVPRWKDLTFALSDSLWCNRHIARELLLKSAPGWKSLAKLAPKRPDAALRWEWLLLAIQSGERSALDFIAGHAADLDEIERLWLRETLRGTGNISRQASKLLD